MTRATVVDDPGDPRLDPIRAVRATERAIRARGLVVAESPLTIARVITSGHRVELLVATPDVLTRFDDVSAISSVLVADQAVLDEAVGFPIHRGAIAIVRPPASPTIDGLAGTGTRIAVLDGVGDLENLGVIFRSAAGLGIDAIVLGPGSGDPWSRRAVRVSVGTSLDVPWVAVADLPAALGALRAGGYHIAALTPESGSSLDDALGEDERLALVLGAEGPGLSAAALAQADSQVSIPMTRGVDSLNVAAAAAIAFHACRRR